VFVVEVFVVEAHRLGGVIVVVVHLFGAPGVAGGALALASEVFVGERTVAGGTEFAGELGVQGLNQRTF